MKRLEESWDQVRPTFLFLMGPSGFLNWDSMYFWFRYNYTSTKGEKVTFQRQREENEALVQIETKMKNRAISET